MFRLIARRLLQLPLILIVIYTITLALAWAVPGNPLENPEGRRPPPEVVAAMKARYNLDSFWSFYGSYLDSASGFKAMRAMLSAAEPPSPASTPFFDLGPSLQYRDQTVNEIIGSALPVSVVVGAAAILVALVVGLTAGIAGAARPRSLADYGTLAIALVGISVPNFVVGTALLLVFSVKLAWFPIGSWGNLRDLVLPAVTLSLPFAAYIARLTRMGMAEQLQSDYIRTARAKGASEYSVLLRHALKNAFLPVLSYLGPAGALAMTGSFVVERIFTVPGMGQHFVSAVQNKDLFLIIGVVLVYSTILIALNLAVDMMYRWIDPRMSDASA